MDRQQKQEFVADLRGRFQETSTVVVAHYSGLTVQDMEALRKRVRDAGATFRVTKNRLTRLALEGTVFGSIGGLLKGPIGIAMSADPVAAAKVMVEFAKTNEKLVVLGGAYGGSSLDAEGVKALASMPSLDELRARLVGMIQTPATRIAGILSQPGASVARVVHAYSAKEQAA